MLYDINLSHNHSYHTFLPSLLPLTHFVSTYSIAEAVLDTLEWRRSINFPNVVTSDLHVLAPMLYVTRLDSSKRPIIYFRPGLDHPKQDGEKYLRQLVYTIERCIRIYVHTVL